MYKRLEGLLRKQVNEGFASLDSMQKAVRRHKVKFMESLEDDPQDYLSELLIPDILFTNSGIISYTSFFKRVKSSFNPNCITIDIGKEGEKYGRWFQMANILDDLEKKKQPFWSDLIKKWLLDPPHVNYYFLSCYLMEKLIFV